MSAPCGWTITGCRCGESCWTSYSPEVQAVAGNLATGIMWAATGRRYGLCPVVVQPTARPALASQYQTYPVTRPDFGTAYIAGGQWYNGVPGEDGAACCPGCSVDLEGPTTTVGITKVTVSGVVVAPAAYQVQNGHILVRLDGQCWPTCINHSAVPAAFVVEYLKGEAIPAHVQSATDLLACEFAKACTGGACGLPRRLRSLTRQGVEVQVTDELVAEGGKIRTGIHEVDLVIAADNPSGRASRSLVVSPDTGVRTVS
jgi:hypothetical protein